MDIRSNRPLQISIAVLAASLLLTAVSEPPPAGPQAQPISYTEMLTLARDGHLGSVTLQGRTALISAKDGRSLAAWIPEDARPSDQLAGQGVEVRAVPRPSPGIAAVLVSWLPMLLMIGLLAWSVTASRGRGSGLLSVGRSRARLHDPSAEGRVTFDDVAGIEQAKQDLSEVVDFLRDPGRFRALGARIPKGVLLVGPPGTGKTLVARAVAGEAGVPFFSVAGSDFVEMFVGVGASRVRDTFERARKAAPAIVFIDEIDAMGRNRGTAAIGNDEREQTLNQMLVEMDGFGTGGGDVIVVAATNRPDVLDPALLRPGRFDRQVIVPNPDVAGREAILGVHMRKVVLAEGVSVASTAPALARGTPGFSGADLANLVNEAALLAARGNAPGVAAEHFDAAKDRIMLGAERRSLTMSDDERRTSAYHEAGHAVCAINLPASDPVHKATIVPRGMALGLVVSLPEGDRVSLNRERLDADLAMAMGGRVAEEMMFGRSKVTTGAQADIKAVTDIAWRMVTEWGFSDEVGTVRYAGPGGGLFPGHSGAEPQHSEATARLIDDEVRRIVREAADRAKELLSANRAALVAVAEELLRRETLTGAEIRGIAREAMDAACEG